MGRPWRSETRSASWGDAATAGTTVVLYTVPLVVENRLETAGAGEIVQLYFEAPEGEGVAPGTIQVVNVRLPG